MPLDVNGLEVLSPEECVRLLGTRSLGRIAISSGALPVILPVNYVVIGDQVVVRTRRGTRLAAATRHAIVAFEVDEIDDGSGGGWSVMVQGVAREIIDPPALVEARAAVLARWIDPSDGRYVGVSLDVVSGRRIPPFVEDSLAEGGDHHGLDGVEPVLGLVEHDAQR
jgi:nitroimidazol reductase NimA-like FMN-containing flavoprotein (pyridoxamine 5'-phosphate oxidase superfamily)